MTTPPWCREKVMVYYVLEIKYIFSKLYFVLYCKLLYPEWPHRQCVCLVIRRSHVRSSLSAVSLVICSPARIAVCTVQYVELRGYCPVQGGGCNQLIGSTVSDDIVRSWLWLTATRSSPSGYFSKLLPVVDN